MDLAFGFSFSFSTAGKSKSVKIYNDESECSPMDRDIQVGIRHGGWSLYGSEREGRKGDSGSGQLSCREANAFPDTIPRVWGQTSVRTGFIRRSLRFALPCQKASVWYDRQASYK